MIPLEFFQALLLGATALLVALHARTLRRQRQHNRRQRRTGAALLAQLRTESGRAANAAGTAVRAEILAHESEARAAKALERADRLIARSRSETADVCQQVIATIVGTKADPFGPSDVRAGYRSFAEACGLPPVPDGPDLLDDGPGPDVIAFPIAPAARRPKLNLYEPPAPTEVR